MTASALAPASRCSLMPRNRATNPLVRRPTGAQLQPHRSTAAAATVVRAAQKRVYKSFHEMIEQSPEPVLVEFYATWCGPCQMMGGILDEVAPVLRNRVKFVKVDTEKYPTVASEYQIGALPTLILFKKGQPVDRIEGVVAAPDLRNRLEYLCH